MAFTPKFIVCVYVCVCVIAYLPHHWQELGMLGHLCKDITHRSLIITNLYVRLFVEPFTEKVSYFCGSGMILWQLLRILEGRIFIHIYNCDWYLKDWKESTGYIFPGSQSALS